MSRIISCSRRTDIPAFYAKWLISRLRAGYCHIINRYNNRVFEIPLKREDCTALVFWTRNPAPLFAYFNELDARGYSYYFHYTILGYPRPIEAYTPPLKAAIDTFRRLATRLSADRVRWRYDPIVFSSVTPPDYHRRQFEHIASQLKGYTHHCTFSFTSFYNKTTRNLGTVTEKTGISFQEPVLTEQQALARDLAQIAADNNMTLNTCCSDALMAPGVQKNHCVDPDLIRALVPGMKGDLKAEPTRQDCGCVASVDIGAYDMCLFGCAYCYATNSRTVALKNHRKHNPEDSVLWRPPTFAQTDLRPIAVAIKK